MKKFWEVYYITLEGYCNQLGCDSKKQALGLAKQMLPDLKYEYIEVRAHNGEELLDDTEIVLKRGGEIVV